MKVLITGGTGLIGRHLIPKLKNKGYDVAVLSRNPAKEKQVNAYRWNIKTEEIDKDCLTGVDFIIHLAGANIGEKRWTQKRKQEIIDSRVLSIKLLYKAIEETQTPVQAIVSSSALGYYADRGNELLTEQSSNGDGFLAQCCRQWENAVVKEAPQNTRVVRLRIGLLLAREGLALKRMESPVTLLLAFPLGTGKQWVSWIHFDDLLDLFLRAIEDPSMLGAYNACSPNPVINEQLMKEMAQSLHRPAWKMHVPEFVLKALYGQMISVVLMSTRASSEKLIRQGFQFKFSTLDKAFNDIY